MKDSSLPRRVLGNRFLMPQTGLVCLLLWANSAYSMPYFKPDLPDFYQHQKSDPKVNVEKDDDIDFTNPTPRPDKVAPPNNGTVPSYDFNRAPGTNNATDPGNLWWENGGGWCCVTAFVNSFYYLEKHFGYDGFFTRAGEPAGTKWQQEMIFAIEDLADQLFYKADGTLRGPGDAPRTTVPQYVRSLEQQSREKLEAQGKEHKSPLSISEFFLGSGNKVQRVMADATGMEDFDHPTDVSGSFGSLFDAYHHELCNSEDVELTLIDPDRKTGAWWSGVQRDPMTMEITAVGFHVVTGAGVEDCQNKMKRTLYFADPDKRNELMGGAYTDMDIRMPYPDGEIPLPIGRRHYEMATVNENGEIIDGFFKGAIIAGITAISPIPEPSTLLLLGSGLAGLAWWKRRRR